MWKINQMIKYDLVLQMEKLTCVKPIKSLEYFIEIFIKKIRRMFYPESKSSFSVLWKNSFVVNILNILLLYIGLLYQLEQVWNISTIVRIKKIWSAL